MTALAVAAGVPAGVGCRVEDGVFAGEVLGGGLILVPAESAKHAQRSADDGQGGSAQSHLG